MNKATVIIVDDHLLVSEMWAELISSDSKYAVIATCNNTDEASLQLIKEKKPDLILMDINIQPLSGIDATKIIRKSSPGTKVIGVSMHNQPSIVRQMIKSGALGYVTKNSSKNELMEAIAAALQGKVYVCKEIQTKLSQQFLVNDDQPDLSKLTVREIQIIKLIKEGFTSKEISQKLFLSSRTIEVYRYNILKKLNQKNTTSLLKLINNNSLVI